MEQQKLTLTPGHLLPTKRYTEICLPPPCHLGLVVLTLSARGSVSSKDQLRGNLCWYLLQAFACGGTKNKGGSQCRAKGILVGFQC